MVKMKIILAGIGPVYAYVDENNVAAGPYFTREQLEALEDAGAIRNLRFTAPRFDARFEIHDINVDGSDIWADSGLRIYSTDESIHERLYTFGETAVEWEPYDKK